MFSFDFCVTLGGVLGGILLGAAVGTAVTVYGAMTCLWQVLNCAVLYCSVLYLVHLGHDMTTDCPVRNYSAYRTF
jgi:hypothetical protein